MGVKGLQFDELLTYAIGELDAEQASHIAERLRTDAGQAARLARVQAVLAGLRSHHGQPPSPAALMRAYRIIERRAADTIGWVKRLHTLVARLVYDSRAQPACGLRGGGGDVAYQLAYQGDLADIDLEIQRATAGRWRLTGHVDPREGLAVDEVAITHADGDEPTDRVVPNAQGVFLLELPSANYDLFVRGGEKVQVIPDLNLD